MKHITTLIITCLCIPALSFAWGQKGHDTVAYIAQQHLTDTSKAAIDSLLDGYSITYWANWLDNASHTPEYEYTKTWHYKNIDKGQLYEKAPNIKEGNIVDAIYSQVAVLEDSTSSKSERALALKMLIHFLGDIHQPLHMGHASDKGGNYWKVKWFKGSSNLHTVWDTNLVDAAHAWSHTEWQREIDRLSPEDVAEIVMDGNPDTWGKETYLICSEIYDCTPEDTIISYDYIADWTPVIEKQFLRGGLRLADLLNSIFDSKYNSLNSFVKK